MTNIDLSARLNLAFDMWERRHGHPLADTTVAEWLTGTGYPVTAHDITALRRGESEDTSIELRTSLAQVFGVDPGFFAAAHLDTHTDDLEVAARFDNRALRRLGQLAQGMPLRTLLYLDNVADTLRRAEQLPEMARTAQI